MDLLVQKIMMAVVGAPSCGKAVPCREAQSNQGSSAVGRNEETARRRGTAARDGEVEGECDTVPRAGEAESLPMQGEETSFERVVCGEVMFVWTNAGCRHLARGRAAVTAVTTVTLQRLRGRKEGAVVQGTSRAAETSASGKGRRALGKARMVGAAQALSLDETHGHDGNGG